jgi:hypothetical protein
MAESLHQSTEAWQPNLFIVPAMMMAKTDDQSLHVNGKMTGNTSRSFVCYGFLQIRFCL